MFDASRAPSARSRDRIRDILREYYIQVSTTKMTREEFEAFVDQIVAVFAGTDEPLEPEQPT